MNAEQTMRSQACNIVLELIKAEKLEFSTFADFQAKAEEYYNFIKGE